MLEIYPDALRQSNRRCRTGLKRRYLSSKTQLQLDVFQSVMCSMLMGMSICRSKLKPLKSPIWNASFQLPYYGEPVIEYVHFDILCAPFSNASDLSYPMRLVLSLLGGESN